MFWPVTHFDFVNFDDPHYVTGNDFVRSGLMWGNVKQAFVGAAIGNWHPLTWVSHMADCELFGLKAGGHHLMSLLLHLANTVLLFFVWKRMTGAVWRSGFVAALFALHPLHVESVAWIAERKDVLSTFFGLLAIWAYVCYAEFKGAGARSPSSKSKVGICYAVALLFFSLSLMSKGMLVTFPFLLLLLDYWPLGRVPNSSTRDTKPGAGRFSVLIWEKVPFFALAVACSVITFFAQREDGAVRPLEEFSVSFRLANAVVSYAQYIRKVIWPSDLAVFYPFPSAWPVAWVVGAGLLLFGISAAAIYFVGRKPYLFVGWCWFLGTLVPVIGLVQVGEQAMADRYSYVPLIGLFVAAVWGGFDLVERKGKNPRIALAVAGGAVVVVACAVLTALQVRHWKNTETLFLHAIRVTKDNYLAMNHLSTDLILQDRIQEAEKYLVEAVRLRPRFHDAQLSLGNVLAMQGRLEEAKPHFLEALKILPDSEQAYYNLGNLLRSQGELERAMEAFSAVLEINPNNADAHSNAALLLVGLGKMEEAAAHYAEAARLKPGDADVQYNFATAAFSLGNLKEAETIYLSALRLRPEFAQAHLQLARILKQKGSNEEAVRHLQEALRINPGYDEARRELAAMGDSSR